MHMWTYAFFNLVLAGLFTFVSDSWNVVTVVDQMCQAVDQKAGVGYEAYAAPGGEHSKTAAAARWFVERRLAITRSALVVLWGVGVPLMVADYVRVDAILSGDAEPGEAVGRSAFWSSAANDEFARHFVGCLVAALNILIVMQDWDFPDFSGGDIKISALDIESLRFDHCCAWVRKLVPPIYVSGKWVNYMGILMGLAFDWGYWFMTSLCFRPCDYAQFWESDTGKIYALTRPKKVQEAHAGAAAALDCAWFTDSPLLQLAKVPYDAVNRTLYDDDAWFRSAEPHVVLVETGTFTGAYTVDEQDAYVYVADGAWLMWMMCLIPVGAWVVFWWLVFTHEKVHCLNYRDVVSYLDKHRERIAGEDDDVDGKRHKRRAYVAAISEAARRPPRCKCDCLLRRDRAVHVETDPEQPSTWATPGGGA